MADIVDIAVSAGSFNTLVAAVKAANLVDTLKGSGPFTVSTPTDEALAKLPAGTVPNWCDRTWRSLPPHFPMQNRRLAFQTQVLGDVKVTKFEGNWGQGSQTVWT